MLALSGMLTKNPIGDEDGVQRYQYANSRTLFAMDPTGMIQVTTGKITKGACGAYSSANWDFLLDKSHFCGFGNADANLVVGYIVQKVTVSCFGGNCIEFYPCREHVFVVIPDAEDETYTYYEAWPILFNQRRTFQKTNKFNDEAKYPSQNDRRGSYKQEGEIRFFCNSVIGADLSNVSGWHNPLRSGRPKFHGKLCPTTSYELLSWSEDDNKGPPPFWNGDMDGEKIATRSFDLSWSCCKPKQNVELNVEPPKKIAK